ncbi:MAG: efflux RND transporter permease subunit [Cyanothece sp. SIO2G6]|nr:efflux RND transporter permease subunit [Cyanothece sp. SIO2G6]
MVRQFTRNGRLLILTLILIAVWGITSYLTLPRLEDPELISRNAVVKTFLPGASAERVEALITEPLEEEFAAVEEILTYESTSRAGSSVITLELNETVAADEVDTIWSRVRDKMNQVAVTLPPGTTAPELDEVEVKGYAIIASLTWRQDDAPNYTILSRLVNTLEERLQAIPGSESTDLFGVPDEEIVVEVDSAQLVSLGLTSVDVSRQLANSDAKGTAGQFRGAIADIPITLDNELDSLTRLRQTPITFGRDDQFVYLDDIAQISKGTVEPLPDVAIVKGQPAVVIGTFIESSTRIDQWARTARAILADFETQLPRSISLDILFDQSTYVQARLDSLTLNLVLGAGLVFLVTLVMMGWRSAIIIGLALPLSLLMVLGCMTLLEIPLHQMSITGLVIALGILIDTAIVMVDEVYVQMRQGQTPEKAIAHSINYLAVPLLSSTLTTVLAFLPIALLPGATGEFVGTIGINVILSITASLLLSLSIIPVLATKLYQLFPPASPGLANPSSSRRSPSSLSWWQHGISTPYLTQWYEWSIFQITRRPWVGIGLALALPIVGLTQLPFLEQQFFPAADRNQLHIEVELPATAALNHTRDVTKQLRDRLIQDPDVVDVHWFVGHSVPRFYYNLVGGRENEANFAQAMVLLKGLSTDKITQRLQATVDEVVPNAQAVVRQLGQGPPFDAPVELRVTGPDLNELQSLGEIVRSRLTALPNVTHTRATLNDSEPELELVVDEESAQTLALDKATIAQQLNTTLEGITGGSILEATEELPVRVRLSNGDRADIVQLESINLLPPTAGSNPSAPEMNWVPLSSIATVTLNPERSKITRYNGQRVNIIQGFVTAGILPDRVLAQLQRQVAEIPLPAGYSIGLGGEAEERSSALGGLVSTIGVLSVLMVTTLVLSLGSFRLATLIGGVAVAAFGLGIFSIAVFGYPFGFNPIIGSVGLIGVAINDSIVVLAALNDDPEARLGDRYAIRKVVMKSTRHVLTTTFTTMIGFVPLLLGGGEFWPPLAVAIAGGVGGATLLALYLIPSAYILLQPNPRPSTGSGTPTPRVLNYQ